MRVLLLGAGIAGLTLAFWLAHYWMRTTLIEKAPKLRTGRYIIDFWGAEFEIADRMGLLHAQVHASRSCSARHSPNS